MNGAEENEELMANDSTRLLSSVYEETDFPAPSARFSAKFPASLEKHLQPFDDYIIHKCQKFNGKFFLGLDLFITALSAIETGIAAPLIMFILGWDGVATELTFLMIILSVLSQIPKRFLWRWRPYMVWRAKKLRDSETAVTSSFPSRAVTCATVYSFMGVYAYVYNQESDRFQMTWWMPILVISSVLLSSFARVNMGVHYPTDCIIGFIQGVVVCVSGTFLWHVNAIGCESCFSAQCYSLHGTTSIIDKDHLFRINWITFGIGLIICFAIVVISVVKPIDFWAKCDRVYGILLPGLLFKVTFICKGLNHVSLGEPKASPWYGYIFGMALTGLVTFISFKFRGRYPIVSFGILFVLCTLGLFIWRIYVLPTV
eukprot:TRINITY_DN13603_c0_g1_i1.p1 TRINITY_DN13603_c0_g1~~TRINITY_DN13603_c0_g1_i1.p1  ORF type:complete len:372 (+),score=43.36 TRINITY_DN13603_c0_g1_i1:123-1238(+)